MAVSYTHLDVYKRQIVDISILVSNQNENKYYQAISEFLSLLEKHQNVKDVYIERTYSKVDRFWKPKKEELEELSLIHILCRKNMKK